MTIKTLFIVVTLFVFSTLGGCSRLGGVDNPVAPSGVTPKVYMDPSTKSVINGNSFTVNVYIENVTNLFYASVYLTYDPTKITYTGSSEGSFLKKGGASVTFSPYVPPVQNGELIMGITRLGASSGGASGTGILCSATFTAVATGTSTITINQNSSGFRNVNNSDIQITVGNGTTVNIP